MTVKPKRTVRARAPVKPVIPPTKQEFRDDAHKMLDLLLDDYPGSDAIAFIIDGLSGNETASIPMSLSVKSGLILAVAKKILKEVNGDEE